MSATDVSTRDAVFFDTNWYLHNKLKIIGSSLPQTTTKQTAVNIHAETLKKNSTNRVVPLPLRLWAPPASPCPSQWQFKLNGSGERICTVLWLFQKVKSCHIFSPPTEGVSWLWRFGMAPTDAIPLESDANNAQFWRWIVKMVLTLFFLNHLIRWSLVQRKADARLHSTAFLYLYNQGPC